jgi:hypothetical protein
MIKTALARKEKTEKYNEILSQSYCKMPLRYKHLTVAIENLVISYGAQ